MAHGVPTGWDWQIRLFIYTFFVENGRPPTFSEAAEHFGLEPEAARLAFHSLNDAHAIFLNPGTDDIRMANPLSAVPTDYRVSINGKRLWANCAWDSLGIPAMLHADATIEAKLRLTGEKVSYAVQDGALKAEGGVVHFVLPFARWYDDLVQT